MKEVPARLFLIPAHKAPVCLVIRRKPSKRWHVMLWHTDTDQIEHGSWFWGTLYPHRMDLSWDGRYLVYLAVSSNNQESWNGVCEPPWLKTLVHWENMGSWTGSGLFVAPDHLLRNYLFCPGGLPEYAPVQGEGLPFKIGQLPFRDGSEDEGVLYPKLRRDGWQEVGKFPKGEWRHNPSVKSPGWWNQPTQDHPILRMWFRGVAMKRAPEFRVYEFGLESNPELLKGAQWATWDSLGQLLVARAGCIERYSLEDLKRASPTPSFMLDLNDLDAPPRKSGTEID